MDVYVAGVQHLAERTRLCAEADRHGFSVQFGEATVQLHCGDHGTSRIDATSSLLSLIASRA